MALVIRLLLCYLVLSVGYHSISSETHPLDAALLFSLKQQWQNTPPSWSKSFDPCGDPWEGVTCVNSRVTGLDLSFNRKLSGTLPPQIGDLKKLETLILRHCSFTGKIPAELGNLAQLSFLSLSGNNFTHVIPASLGALRKLQYLDLADNQLTGYIPESNSLFPGLDLLLNLSSSLQDLGRNKLSGQIPRKLFGPNMALTQVLLEGNQLSGGIPSTLGLVQTLEVVNLGGNSLTGCVPSNINNLINLIGLDIQNNKSSGPLPNLSGMNSLLRVDLSNNYFEKTKAPAWISTLPSLGILVLRIIDNGPLYGLVPKKLFASPHLVVVSLRNNAFYGTLQIDNNINQKTQSVDLGNNNISSISVDSEFNSTLILTGNPVCNYDLRNAKRFCQAE